MAGIFSDADMQDFADLARDLALKDTCDIMRLTVIPDDRRGGEKKHIKFNTDPIPCAIVDSGLHAQEQEVGLSTRNIVVKTILLPRSTAILSSDQIVSGGITYDVVGMPDPTSYEVLRRVDIQEH